MTRPDYTIGVDPGSRWTGLALRTDTGLLLNAAVVDRNTGNLNGNPPAPATDEDYLTRTLNVLDGLLLGVAQLKADATLTVAVEGLNPPNPRLGMIALADLLGTAIILGAVRGYLIPAGVDNGFTVVTVPPGQHGQKPLAAYPPALRGPRETNLHAIGGGLLRHARSAYDVAGIAGLYTDPPTGTLPPWHPDN